MLANHLVVALGHLFAFVLLDRLPGDGEKLVLLFLDVVLYGFFQLQDLVHELCGGRLHLLDFLEHALHLLMLFERLAYIGPVALADGRVEYGFLESSEARRVGKEGVSTCRSRWW